MNYQVFLEIITHTDGTRDSQIKMNGPMEVVYNLTHSYLDHPTEYFEKVQYLYSAVIH